MGITTQIPAFHAHVGDWNYYICVMTYAQVAQQVSFQHELDAHRDLQRLMQRGLSDRADEIRKYLLENEHRFLGALVVAVWGGEPKYYELQMTNPDPRAPFLDDGIGILSFDGSQSYFALDGQHRLRAIKDAVAGNPELGSDQIAVLIVPHLDDAQGRLRTRRLFTNINRHAKSTTAGENIALDEDDGFAVLTRQMIASHPLLSRDGVIRVFTKPPDQVKPGHVSLGTNAIPKSSDAWTNIGTLYAMLVDLGFELDATMNPKGQRPTDDVLNRSHDTLVSRLDDLLAACGGLGSRLTQNVRGRELRAPDRHESDGHPFMRPVVQKLVARVARYAVSRNVEWKEFLSRLADLTWVIGCPPWTAVFNVEATRMITGKDNRNLLEKLLRAHLVPTTTNREIKEARREYRALIGREYPISFDQMRGA